MNTTVDIIYNPENVLIVHGVRLGKAREITKLDKSTCIVKGDDFRMKFTYEEFVLFAFLRCRILEYEVFGCDE